MIIAIKGKKNSGKTAFIEKLLKKLNGYREVVIKSSGHERIDDESKDTFRYRKAGSRAALIAVKEESVLFMDSMGLEDAISFVRRKLAPDFIIVEGYKSVENLKCRVVDVEEKPDVEAIYQDMIKSLKRRRMEIFVDGKPLPMNEFVEEMMYNVVKSMLSTLKRGEGKEVEILLHERA